MALGDYSDYDGWQWRDDRGWSAELYYKEYEIPKWGGGYVDRLIVMGEQGLGDQIFWASLLPECRIRVKEVVYECDSRINAIVSRSLGVECRPIRASGISVDGDAFIPAADLMRMFRREKAHFPGKPYLKASRERIDSLEQYKGSMGCAWYGRQGKVDPALFRGCVSLQYDHKSQEVEDCPVDARNDIEGLFALVSLLAGVVTVPQTVHHIAGSLGVKTQILLPTQPGEIENQVSWDYPLGRLPWYKDTEVLSVQDYNQRSRKLAVA